ncbi:DUF4038 domain-containing protein [Candidatus Woesearchaeota archaeon]|nr:DUF4038 domain-containing protein [Candidatus Woesearchaeota archaeon]
MRRFLFLALISIMLSTLVPAYDGYSDPYEGFRLGTRSLLFAEEEATKTLTITVEDDAVYQTGHYSINNQWVPFTFTEEAVNGWIRTGTASASITIPRSSNTDNFVITYSCSRTGESWDCHGNRWQLHQFNTTTEDAQRQWDFENDIGGTLHGASITEDEERGNVLLLDGQDDYLDIGAFSTAGDELTIAAWFNLERLPPEKDPRIICKGESQDYQDWALLIHRDGYPEFRYDYGWQANPEGVVAGATTSVTTGEWHHVAGVYGQGRMTLYYDGVAVASKTLSTGTVGETSNPVWIGGQPTDPTNRPFPGMIDDVRVYERALTAAEIAGLHAGLGTTGKGVYLDCEAVSGTIVADASGAGNDGELHGPEQATGKHGKGLAFAHGDHVRIPGLLGMPESMTLAAWVNLESLGSYGSDIISLGDNALLRLRNDRLDAYFYDGNDWQETSGAATITTGKWTHVAYTIDNDAHAQRLYRDGMEIAATNHAGSIDYARNADTYIGIHGDGQGHFSFAGTLDEIRVHGRALSAGEIAALAGTSCSSDEECPESTTTTYCSGNDAYRQIVDWSCADGACEEETTTTFIETCTYGCSSGACTACTPNDNECGSDGCGGQHPACAEGHECQEGVCVQRPVPNNELQPLRVSDNNRYVVKEDGTPFFYLGDTAWRLPYRAYPSEVDEYLETRAEQGFTVIMMDAFELSPDNQAIINLAGEKPFINDEVTRFNEAYWGQVDHIIDKADALGLYVALLPVWGSTVVRHQYVDADNAYDYGVAIGERYKDRDNLVWVMGGDHRLYDYSTDYIHVYNEIARGVTQGCTGGQHHDEVIMTLHTAGWTYDVPYRSSSDHFHDEAWLDFNSFQSGHGEDYPNHDIVEHDYALTPAKPTQDAEPIYEGHWFSWNEANGMANDVDVRHAAYWSVFAGSFGHTYGHCMVFQFYKEEFSGKDATYHFVCGDEEAWMTSLQAAGANDMRHLRNLMESRPFLERVPDQAIIASSTGTGDDHAQATRASDGSYLMVYYGSPRSLSIDLDKLSGTQAKAWWYDPRTGQAADAGTHTSSGEKYFTPPSSSGPDWVLVIDDESKGFPQPGT